MLETYLSRLPDELARRIEARLDRRVYKKDEAIITFEDPSKDVFFLKKGRVKIENYGASGRLMYHATLEDGGVIGQFAALGDVKRTANVVALGPCTLYLCRREDFLTLVTASPENARDMMHGLLDILDRNMRRLDAITGLDARSRVAAYLLGEIRTRQSREIVIPKRDELASYLNMTRETLSRILNDMIIQNMIILSGRARVEILDVSRLEQELQSF